MTTAFSLGQIIGPSFAGHLRDATGSFALPTLCAAVALLAATALAWKR
jgi:cyanate permease